ncbi:MULTISPECIES: hypothetical protein [Pseudoxanthomonas]|jgi:hypothetical protein|nr:MULTISPECIES: hypothetical protein [Pseudoxanthomonas]
MTLLLVLLLIAGCGADKRGRGAATRHPEGGPARSAVEGTPERG